MSDNPPPSDDPGDKFYALYGRCINQWAHIEERFFGFFAFALGSTKKNAAIVYYEWKEFSVQAKLTNSLMSMLLAKKSYRAQRQSWSAIMGSVGRHRAFRNELAHEPIRGWLRLRLTGGKKPPLSEEEKKKLGLGRRFFELYRPPMKVLGGRKPNLFKNTLPVIREEHLVQHLNDVKALRAAIDKFGQDFDQTIRERYLRLSTYIARRQARQQSHSS